MLFGLPAHWRPTTDPASVTGAIKVLSGARLRGSIDLVERRADGALRVTDHKTGKGRVQEGAVVRGGQALQNVLYGLL
jgi:ATP-dependent helicase/nuclease subunit B